MDFKETDIEIKLPETITVHIPSLSDLNLEDVAEVIAKDGVKLIKDTIKQKVLDEFIKRHDKYIQDEVQRLTEEKMEDLKKVLNK